MNFWSKLFGLDSVEVPRQDQPPYAPMDKESLQQEMMTTDPEYRKIMKNHALQDMQLVAAKKAEAEYKETKDADKLVAFWEKSMKDGWIVPGATWPFKLTDAYYRAKRYDDAWRELNKLVLNPDTRRKARQWQIRVLKKEKKDYSQIQHLLDTDT